MFIASVVCVEVKGQGHSKVKAYSTAGTLAAAWSDQSRVYNSISAIFEFRKSVLRQLYATVWFLWWLKYVIEADLTIVDK